MVDRQDIQKEINDITRNYIEKRNSDCIFKEYCVFCSENKDKHDCVLYSNNSFHVVISEHCFQCISFDTCLNVMIGVFTPNEIPNFSDHLADLPPILNSYRNLKNGFIPGLEIDTQNLRKTLIEYVKKENFESIAFSPQKIFSIVKLNFLRDSITSDIHTLLQYKDEIILLTNIEDKYCSEIFKEPARFINLLEFLKPDAFTTLDGNFYIDQPDFVTAIQLQTLFTTNAIFADIDIPQIGLVPPTKSPYFEIAILTQVALGHTVIAMPMYEINSANNLESNAFRKDRIAVLRKYQKRYHFKTFLLSASPRKGLFANSFTSQSWFRKKGERKEFLRKQTLRLNKKLGYRISSNLLHPQRSLL